MVFWRFYLSTSTTCRYCGDRFTVQPRAGRNTARRRGGPGKVSYPLARYCSSRCKMAASRARRIPSSAVTESHGGRVYRSAVTSPQLPIENTNEFRAKKTGPGRLKGCLTFWRWYERLDGSSDLYCDTETTMRHVARVVRNGGRFRLVKPLTNETWLTRKEAHSAGRKLCQVS